MKLQLSPPWVTYFNEMKALFAQDGEIKPFFDQEENVISIYAANTAKAEALMELLPTEKAFGNVTISIKVYPANGRTGDKYECAYKAAFDGNPLFKYVKTVDSPLGTFKYVVWKRDILQFFNDSLSDIAGNKTMVCADAASDVLISVPGTFHCTEPKYGLVEDDWP